MTRDNSKRDIWEEVKQEQKEKEELGWNSGYSVDDLKEDYDDLIPPSRYDKIFISQIGEMEFIVDDEDKENYFEIYDLEPDFDEHHYDDRYKNEIGIYRIEERSTHRWEEILKRVRNETWIKFSQENQDWLERQEKLFTTIKTIKEKNKQVEELKLFQDHPDLIPPSRYDKIFVSQISETEFIVDQEKENYFEMYDVEPDPPLEWVSGEIFDYEIGITIDEGKKIYDLEPDFDEWEYDEEIGVHRINTHGKGSSKYENVNGWSIILEQVRNNEDWIKFSQENQDWLERQEELLTLILEQVRNNEDWIKFSQENQDWLERQEELLTLMKEKQSS